MKVHPQFVYLIEPESKKTWRIVARQTTAKGYKEGHMPTVATNLPKDMARDNLRKLKCVTAAVQWGMV